MPRSISARLKQIQDPAVAREMARALALWMSYEDVMRVAQLKLRRARMDEVRDEVKAAPGQIVHVTEYMHPRWQEVCDTLPRRPRRVVAQEPDLEKDVSRRGSRRAVTCVPPISAGS